MEVSKHPPCQLLAGCREEARRAPSSSPTSAGRSTMPSWRRWPGHSSHPGPPQARALGCECDRVDRDATEPGAFDGAGHRAVDDWHYGTWFVTPRAPNPLAVYPHFQGSRWRPLGPSARSRFCSSIGGATRRSKSRFRRLAPSKWPRPVPIRRLCARRPRMRACACRLPLDDVALPISANHADTLLERLAMAAHEAALSAALPLDFAAGASGRRSFVLLGGITCKRINLPFHTASTCGTPTPRPELWMGGPPRPGGGGTPPLLEDGAGPALACPRCDNASRCATTLRPQNVCSGPRRRAARGSLATAANLEAFSLTSDIPPIMQNAASGKTSQFAQSTSSKSPIVISNSTAPCAPSASWCRLLLQSGTLPKKFRQISRMSPSRGRAGGDGEGGRGANEESTLHREVPPCRAA